MKLLSDYWKEYMLENRLLFVIEKNGLNEELLNLLTNDFDLETLEFKIIEAHRESVDDGLELFPHYNLTFLVPDKTSDDKLWNRVTISVLPETVPTIKLEKPETMQFEEYFKITKQTVSGLDEYFIIFADMLRKSI